MVQNQVRPTNREQGMTEAILRLLSRAGRSIPSPFNPQSEYRRPQRGDAARDAAHIAGDMKKIGGDLRKVAKKELAKHGK